MYYPLRFYLVTYRWRNKQLFNAEGRTRTDTKVTLQQFLRLPRLPIPPLRRVFWSGRRDSNSRPPPWQGGILPLNYFRPCFGAEAQNRTGDTRIFSPLLYRLSYLGTENIVAGGTRGVK